MTRRGSLSSPKSSSRFHLRTLVSMSARWLSPRECSVETPSAFRSHHDILLPSPKHPSDVAKTSFLHRPSTLLPSPKHPSAIAKTSFLHCPSTLLVVWKHSFSSAKQFKLRCDSIDFAEQFNLFCCANQFILHPRRVFLATNRRSSGDAKRRFWYGEKDRSAKVERLRLIVKPLIDNAFVIVSGL